MIGNDFYARFKGIMKKSFCGLVPLSSEVDSQISQIEIVFLISEAEVTLRWQIFLLPLIIAIILYCIDFITNWSDVWVL